MIRSITAALVLSLALTGCGGADQQGAEQTSLIVLAGRSSGLVVNGESVPQPLLDAYARKRGWNLTDPGQLAQVKEKIAELLAMAHQARAEGLFDDPLIEADLALERLNLVAGKLLERQQQASLPAEADLQAEYDRESALVGDSEYRVAHILFDQKAMADSALAEAATQDFDAMMARYQELEGVRDARELGWVKRNQLPEVLRDPLQALSVGDVAPQVYQSEFGWHLLKLYETKAFAGPTFAQLKDGIRQSLQRKQTAEFALTIRDSAQVEGL